MVDLTMLLQRSERVLPEELDTDHLQVQVAPAGAHGDTLPSYDIS